MSIFGPPKISKLKAKGDINRLIKIFLQENDLELRKEAAYALGELGDPSAVMPLISVLKNEFWGGFQMDPSDHMERASQYNGLRSVVAQVLGGLGDERAVDPLLAILDAHDPSIFDGTDYLLDVAVRALREIGTTKANEGLEKRGHKR